MSLFCWCERWDLNPHDLTDTSTSSLPVCRFQHARERNLRYYNKIPLFVKRQPEKLPESFASRHPPRFADGRTASWFFCVIAPQDHIDR